MWRLNELGVTAYENFQKEKLASGIVLTRAAVESAAALWFLKEKLEGVIESKAIGSLDQQLMRLLMGSRTDPDLPQAINVLNFVDCINRAVDGARHNYDVLSEFSHPNWAGTAGLFSTIDMENRTTAFGKNPKRDQAPKNVGLLSLVVALDIGNHVYDRLDEIMPEFIKLCEDDLTISRDL